MKRKPDEQAGETPKRPAVKPNVNANVASSNSVKSVTDPKPTAVPVKATAEPTKPTAEPTKPTAEHAKPKSVTMNGTKGTQTAKATQAAQAAQAAPQISNHKLVEKPAAKPVDATKKIDGKPAAKPASQTTAKPVPKQDSTEKKPEKPEKKPSEKPPEKAKKPAKKPTKATKPEEETKVMLNDVLNISNRWKTKVVPAPGFLKTKEEVELEHVSHPYAELTSLGKKHNWRQLLSPESANSIRVCHRHVCVSTCVSPCSRRLDDTEQTAPVFATLMHAYYARMFYKVSWRSEFQEDSNSAFCKDPSLARDAAENGKVSRTVTTANDKKNRKKMSVCPPGVEKDSAFDRAVSERYMIYLFRLACRQNAVYRECLLATQSAILTDGRRNMSELMEARRQEKAGEPLAHPDTPASPITVLVGTLAQFEQGALRPNEIYALSQSATVLQTLESLRKRFPSSFVSTTTGKHLSTRDLSSDEVATNIIWSLEEARKSMDPIPKVAKAAGR
jgi:hypothetical protein